jgi:hypothetical protein
MALTVTADYLGDYAFDPGPDLIGALPLRLAEHLRRVCTASIR